MQRVLYGTLLALLVTGTVVFWWACLVYAAPSVPVVYTNENIWQSQHDTPLRFVGNGQGGYYGYTVSGKYFEQMPVVNTAGVKLHRFSIDEAWYYISDRGVFTAKSDLIALSIYMSTVG